MRLPTGKVRSRIDELIAAIEKLTSLDESALIPQLAKIKNAELRSQLESLMPPRMPTRWQALPHWGRSWLSGAEVSPTARYRRMTPVG
jgi:hypothetical protein